MVDVLGRIGAEARALHAMLARVWRGRASLDPEDAGELERLYYVIGQLMASNMWPGGRPQLMPRLPETTAGPVQPGELAVEARGRLQILEPRISRAVEEFVKKLQSDIVARVAGKLWKRELHSLKRETIGLLPLEWYEAFSEALELKDPELVEARLRRWLRRLLYHSRGRPLPGEEKVPEAEVENAKRTLELAEKALGMIRGMPPTPLREVLKQIYVAALANTMLKRTPGLVELAAALERLQRSPEEYVVEQLAAQNLYTDVGLAKAVLSTMRSRPASVKYWLATGSLVSPEHLLNVLQAKNIV